MSPDIRMSLCGLCVCVRESSSNDLLLWRFYLHNGKEFMRVFTHIQANFVKLPGQFTGGIGGLLGKDLCIVAIG